MPLRLTHPAALATLSAAALALHLAAQAAPAAPAAPAQDAPSPFAAYCKGMDALLSRHPFLGRVKLQTFRDKPPFLFYLAGTLAESSERAGKVVQQYTPLLQAMAEAFDRDYAKPLGLARQAFAKGYTIVVLGSRGSYNDYAQATETDLAQYARAHYEPALRVAVTYVDTFAQNPTDDEERRALLHEFVHALEHAHGLGGRLSQATWFSEGLAEFRATSSADPAALASPHVEDLHLKLLLETLRDPQTRQLWAPLPSLLDSRGYDDVMRGAFHRFKDTGAPVERVLPVFYAQSAVVMEFLHLAENGRYRPALLAYMKPMLQGAYDVTARLQAKEKTGIELRELQPQLCAYVEAQLEKRLHVEVSFAKLGLATAPAGTASRPAGETAATVAWRAEEATPLLGALRLLAAQGRYEEASRCAPDAAKDPAFAVVAREAARAAEVVRLRDALLAQAKQKGLRIAPLVDNKRRGGKVVRFDAGGIVLQDDKTEITLPWSALAPKNLDFELQKHGLVKKGAWPSSWLAAVSGTPAKDALRGMSDPADLAKDLAQDLAAAPPAADAEAALGLLALQGLVPAGEPARARTQLAELEGIVKKHGKHPLFASRRQVLERSTAALVERSFSLDAPECLGLGPEARLQDGRVVLEFDAKSKGLEAVLRPDEGASALILGKERTQVAPGTLVPRGEGWQAGGAQVWLLDMSCGEGLEMQLDYVLQDAGLGTHGIVASYREGSGFLEASCGGQARAFDPVGDFAEAFGLPGAILLGKPHKLRLVRKPSGVAVSLDGATPVTFKVPETLRSGRVGIYSISDKPIEIVKLRIVAQPDEAESETLRKRYSQRTMARVFPR